MALYNNKSTEILIDFFWNYIRIKHRDFSRGIGGIFFDDMDTPSKEDCFRFVTDCANAVIPCYLPIVKKHSEDPFGKRLNAFCQIQTKYYTQFNNLGFAERQWQLIRRGHFAEFNLVSNIDSHF